MAPAASASTDVHVVMGVSGCGKSTVGRLLAQARGATFLDGDDFHPPENVARMAAGMALTDADRQGWLIALSARLAQASAAGEGVVLSCSALKRRYRDMLRQGAPDLRLVYLHGSRELLAARMAARSDHYMPASLLDSQLATLGAAAADESRPRLRRGADAAADRRWHPATGGSRHARIPQGRALHRSRRPRALSRGAHRARRRHAAGAAVGAVRRGGYQLRHSPVGFRSSFHCTGTPQWVFILRGRMEIGLQDGSSRIFKPGEHFYSADTLPAGAGFDAEVHGHWSRQRGASRW